MARGMATPNDCFRTKCAGEGSFWGRRSRGRHACEPQRFAPQSCSRMAITGRESGSVPEEARRRRFPGQAGCSSSQPERRGLLAALHNGAKAICDPVLQEAPRPIQPVQRDHLSSSAKSRQSTKRECRRLGAASPLQASPTLSRSRASSAQCQLRAGPWPWRWRRDRACRRCVARGGGRGRSWA